MKNVQLTPLLFIILTPLSAPAMALSPADHLAIVATVNTVGSSADQKDWARTEAQFTAQPFIDYSSLSGQPGAAVKASDLIGGWATFLGDHVVTQHLLTGHEVTKKGDRAIVTSNVMAWHARADAPNGAAWTVYGTYLHELVQESGIWKVASMRFNLLRQTGDLSILSAIPTAQIGAAQMQRVEFASAGETLVGHLYQTKKETIQPAVAIIGPMTFAKEQAPTEYARRLAAQGFVALAYDSRYRGESGGEPRNWENPFHKVEDLKAAVAFLRAQPNVDPERVSILAICQGSSIALRAAAEIEGLYALTTIAGHYRDREGDITWLTEEGLEARLAQGMAAKAKFTETGEVDYIAAVDETNPNVGMPGAFVWEWYQPWADRGVWENQYAVMSDADLLSFDSIRAAASLTTPWLMIHGDYNFLPAAARRHMAAVPESTPTQTIWDPTPHLAYYDQPEAIDRATEAMIAFFAR